MWSDGQKTGQTDSPPYGSTAFTIDPRGPVSGPPHCQAEALVPVRKRAKRPRPASGSRLLSDGRGLRSGEVVVC